MNGNKNLIMGLWSAMTFDGLERFIGSLRRTSFHGDVCVFVDRVTPDTISDLLTHDILVERADRIATPPMHGQSSRYFTIWIFWRATAKTTPTS
jgi:hypothetical protein